MQNVEIPVKLIYQNEHNHNKHVFVFQVVATVLTGEKSLRMQKNNIPDGFCRQFFAIQQSWSYLFKKFHCISFIDKCCFQQVYFSTNILQNLTIEERVTFLELQVLFPETFVAFVCYITQPLVQQVFECNSYVLLSLIHN